MKPELIHTFYRQCKMPPGVTDRDLLQYMWVKKDESSNTTFVVFKDASHPTKPERKDFIRLVSTYMYTSALITPLLP